jgi:hypothetical protein
MGGTAVTITAQDPYSKYGGSVAAPAQGTDPYAKYGGAAAGQDTAEQPEEKGLISRAWDWINKPTADNFLPKDLKTSDILRGVAFQKMFGEPYLPGTNDFDTKADLHLGDSPTKAAVKTFLSGSARDTADTAAGFTSPLGIGLAATGALGKAGGAVGTIARTVQGVSGAGFATKGLFDIGSAGTENTPEAWKQRLTGGAELAGGAAALGSATAPMVENVFGNAQKAGQLFNRVSAAVGDTEVPVSNEMSTALERILKLKDTGAKGTPQVITKLLNRVTTPGQQPLNFDDARLFYSNVSRLSANEYQQMNPQMQRAVGDFARAFKDSIHDAAEDASPGMGDTLDQAMKLYGRSKAWQQFGSDTWTVGKKAAATAAGVGVAGKFLLSNLFE